MPRNPPPDVNGASDAPKGLSRRGFLRSLGASAIAAAAFGSHAVAAELAGAEAQRKAGPGAVPVTLSVNGKKLALALEPRVTLLEALRNLGGVTGAKEACDRSGCGACTVLMNGEPVNACTLLAIDTQEAEITTIEGLVAEAEAQSDAGAPLTKLQRALIEHDGLQCGFCTPGFVMTLHAFLKKNPHPTEAEVRRACAGNFCRCGSYPRIFAAVLDASGQKVASRVTVISAHDHALAQG
ncbi:MAG TPA: (2Fe-2S)-binding protein [Opitutus sp.]|nr:(2Fe-2S)-binding protein [Opitutus sp.]